MKIVPPAPGRAPTLKELHARRCVMLGITEEWRVEKLWAEEVARRKAVEDEHRPGKRHGRS